MDNNNLIIAIILSVLILAGFQYFYVKPQQEHLQQQALVAETASQQPKPRRPNLPHRHCATVPIS